jgi:hypothetical protein
MPWAEVYKIVKPELLARIDQNRVSTTALTVVPYDRQKSIIERSIVSATRARRLFQASNGYVGLGPMDVKVSDQVCLVKGGNTPFLLRSKNTIPRNLLGTQLLARGSSKFGGVGAVELVGDCYTFGLMDSSDVSAACKQQDSIEIGYRWRNVVVV